MRSGRAARGRPCRAWEADAARWDWHGAQGQADRKDALPADVRSIWNIPKTPTIQSKFLRLLPSNILLFDGKEYSKYDYLFTGLKQLSRTNQSHPLFIYSRSFRFDPRVPLARVPLIGPRVDVFDVQYPCVDAVISSDTGSGSIEPNESTSGTHAGHSEATSTT